MGKITYGMFVTCALSAKALSVLTFFGTILGFFRMSDHWYYAHVQRLFLNASNDTIYESAEEPSINTTLYGRGTYLSC